VTVDLDNKHIVSCR